MKAIRLFLSDGANVHHELLSGQVPDATLPSFVLAVDRLRDQIPTVKLYVEQQLVLAWCVRADGTFQLSLRKQVQHG